MNKELNSVEKARKTKLSKKSNEELIAIILRKDNVEKKQQNQINSYKSTISDLNTKLVTQKEEINNNCLLVNELESQLNNLGNNIESLNTQIDNAIITNHSLAERLVNIKHKLHLSIIMVVVLVIAFILKMIL